MVHHHANAAADLLKEPSETAEGQPDAITTHPKPGDQAELVVAHDVGAVRIRTSNLTIEVKYGGDFYDEDELIDLGRELPSAAEVEVG